MSRITEITDIADPALDMYARLTERQLHPKHAQGYFVAESRTVVTLALAAGIEPVSFLMDKSQLSGASADLAREILADRWGDVPLFTAEDRVLESLTGYALSRGVLAVMRRPILPTVEAVCRGARRIAVLEDIMDSSNVGAIIRTAAALGMDAVLVTPRCSDPLLRRAARVSMGTVFQIPWTVIGASPEDWPGRGMKMLAELGFRTAAMALSQDTVGIADPRLKEAGRLAVILGTEGTGLSSETVRLADWTVKIPMFHGVDSLNVAACAAIAFWEITR